MSARIGDIEHRSQQEANEGLPPCVDQQAHPAICQTVCDMTIFIRAEMKINASVGAAPSAQLSTYLPTYLPTFQLSRRRERN